MKNIKGSVQKSCFKIEIELAHSLMFVDLEAFCVTQIDDYTILIDNSTKMKFDEKISDIGRTAAQNLD
jgi:hypothetical protein